MSDHISTPELPSANNASSPTKNSAQTEKKTGISAEELSTIEKVTAVVSQLRSRQRKIEYIALAVTLFIISGVSFAAWYSDGKIFGDALDLLRSVEKSNDAKNVLLNCRNPKNQKTPYCQDRIADQQQTWSAVTSTPRGKSPAFSLRRQ